VRLAEAATQAAMARAEREERAEAAATRLEKRRCSHAAGAVAAMRLAGELRTYAARLRQRRDRDEIARWIRWVTSYADAVDPVCEPSDRLLRLFRKA